MKDVSSFLGDIEVRKSNFGGRGIFAKKKIFRGQLLLCEKPLAVMYDSTKSSLKNGVKGLMTGGDDWVSHISMSFMQELANNTVTNPELGHKLFDLFDGADRNVEKLPANDTNTFDR